LAGEEEAVPEGPLLPTEALEPLADMEGEALQPLESKLLEVVVAVLVPVFLALRFPAVYAYQLVQHFFVSTFGVSVDAQDLKCQNSYQNFFAGFSTVSAPGAVQV